LVTSFEAESARAKAALRAAQALESTAPGEALRALTVVAQRYPFEEDVRKTASEGAQKLSDQANADVRGLSEAIERFRVYGDETSLRDAEDRASRLAREFPAPGAGDISQLEQNVRGLRGDVVAARTKFDLQRAAPEVRRLARVAELLDVEPEAKS